MFCLLLHNRVYEESARMADHARQARLPDSDCLPASSDLAAEVSAFPELDTSVLKDFFGGNGEVPEAPADAVEPATTEAVARVGLDLSLLNEQLSAERIAVERQVESLEQKVPAQAFYFWNADRCSLLPESFANTIHVFRELDIARALIALSP